MAKTVSDLTSTTRPGRADGSLSAASQRRAMAFPPGIAGMGATPRGRRQAVKTHLPPNPHQAFGLGGRSHLRPKAPERRRRYGGRATTVRQAAVYGSAGAHMELAFRCTCTPLSDVHSPISTHPSRSAFMTSLRGAGSSAMSRTRGSPA